MKIEDTFGPYRVLEKLGEGGMGEVYRARDARLDRGVALKIVPEAFARVTERVARFEREAKTLASLNHSRIAQIYGTSRAVTSARSSWSWSRAKTCPGASRVNRFPSMKR